MKSILKIIAGIGVICGGCWEEGQPEQIPGKITVEFTSILEGEVTTKVSENRWELGDTIGVFMKQSGFELSLDRIVNGAGNVPYRTSGNGNFITTLSDAIVYPEDGRKVDFIAYYPYSQNISDCVYGVNVAQQSSAAKVDLLYADNARGLNLEMTSVPLFFSHQLSRVILNIESGKGVNRLDGLEVTLAGMKTKADFRLADATLLTDENSIADIKVPLAADGEGRRGEVVVLPTADLKNVKLNIVLDGKSQSISIPTLGFEKGKTYTYGLKLENSSVVLDPDLEVPEYRTWLETPQLTQQTMTKCMYVVHYMPNDKNARNYSMLYDTIQKLAYWVAYPLCTSHTGSSGYSGAWDYDPQIKPELQPCLENSFNGYDRGHQIPSGDRTCDRTTNITTFYYTNMTAQVGKGMNQTIWANLENQIRSWRSGVDTLYVVTGAMIKTLTDQNISYVKDNNGKNVAKPKYYFKVLARRIGGAYQTIGFRMENRVYSNSDYNACRVTVADLERETGFTFFPNIPQETKNTIGSAW